MCEIKELKELPEIKQGFTHGGKFHSDDVFATALLKILYPKIKITRGFEVPEDFDGIVYDIGKGRFDHHQADKEVRENGVPYAAFGLLWREFGGYLVGKEEARKFDERFIQPLDLSDNTGVYNDMASAIGNFNPVWDDETPAESRFWEAEAIAKKFLKNYINKVKGSERAGSIVKEAVKKTLESDRKNVMILDRYVPWKKYTVGTGILAVVYPSKRGGYAAQVVPVSEDDNTPSSHWPHKWWGASAEDLPELSKIPTMRFCHANGFLLTCDTLEDAVKAASMAKPGI